MLVLCSLQGVSALYWSLYTIQVYSLLESKLAIVMIKVFSYYREIVRITRFRIGQNCRAVCTEKSGLNASGHSNS